MTGIEIALALIRHFEGCKLHAYVFPGESWCTIGYGHTLPLSQINLTISEKQAADLLTRDLLIVRKDLRLQLGPAYYRLTEGQLGATLSFKFNCKPSLFNNSTFLALLKQQQFEAAQSELRKWVYGEGRVRLPGLVRRRKCEEYVFAGGSVTQLVRRNWFHQQASL
jgi:GH24 family phage-related lysozyme (muramidase)